MWRRFMKPPRAHSGSRSAPNAAMPIRRVRRLLSTIAVLMPRRSGGGEQKGRQFNSRRADPSINGLKIEGAFETRGSGGGRTHRWQRLDLPNKPDLESAVAPNQ